MRVNDDEVCAAVEWYIPIFMIEFDPLAAGIPFI